MDDLDILRVRVLLAEASAASANRHKEFLSKYADLATEVCHYWRSLAPDDAELPDELTAKIDEFSRKADGRISDKVHSASKVVET